MLITRPGPSSQIYHPGLDALRGIAISLVVLYHYFQLDIGWIGVDLFFVLSGFLITRSLINLQDEPGKYRAFFRNRMLRIFPLYFGVLLTFYAAILFLSKDPSKFSFYFSNWIYFFSFSENWLLMGKLVPAESHLNHLWSIAAEEQFYLIWPIIVFVFLKRGAVPVIALALIMSVLIGRIYFYKSAIDFEPDMIIHNTFFRADGFLAGALLNFFRFTKPVVLVTSFCILIIACICGFMFVHTTEQSNAFVFTIGYSIIAMLFATMIALVLTKKQEITDEFFIVKLLVRLGKVSYGVYIFHWIILQFLYGKLLILFLSHISSEYLSGLLSSFVCLGMTLAISGLSYRYFEKAFLKRKYHPSSKAV